jgi:hypothetical protein
VKPKIDVTYSSFPDPMPPQPPREPFIAPPPIVPQKVPTLPVNTQVQPSPPPPDPEVVQAMRRLIDRQPEKAKDILAHYSSPNRESLWALLNIAGRVHEKGLDGLDAEEIRAIQDSMRALSLTFLARAPLLIDKMYFFQGGNLPGDCRRLDAGHVFRAGSSDRPGELVQVHVEFRNLTCAARENQDGHGEFETAWLCEAVITDPHDRTGQPVKWKAYLDGGKVVKRWPVPRTDFSTNYTFYMPNLPTGTLLLTLTLHDLTRPEHPRVTSRPLEFCVTNPSDRTASAR